MLLVREKVHEGLEAPTISGGTARIIAALTAIYLLDVETQVFSSYSGQHYDGWTIPINQMPGLVVIEEPDTALNPLLLKRFVEQLRLYTSREGKPRQIFLTTHNPTLLNYFQPEEVRVVERDEQGYTTVRQVSKDMPYIKDVWLDEHSLGEAWMARVLGGTPE